MKQNIETLKEYFETGDKPSQQNYHDLIDSLAMPMIGEIKAVSFGATPQGWAKCNGQLLDPASHAELFALIGTTFGGDGTTSFALPDLRGRIPINYGTGNGLSTYTIGQVGGEETHVLTEDEMPSHSHTGSIDSGATATVDIPSSSTASDTSDPSNAYMGKPTNIGPNEIRPYANTSDGTMNSFVAPVSGNVTTSTIGTGQPHNIIQPYLAVNYIIAVEGINPL